MKTGIIYLIVAPSGAGKSSLVKQLLANNKQLELSISYTTRQKRDGEEQGREYNFTTIEQFQLMQKNDQFIESALVHGNYYGTSKIWLEQQLLKNKQIILEIDWQGAQQIKTIFSEKTNISYIFILPPSIDELKKRLIERGQDSMETINQRIKGAGIEIQHATDADYVIINKDFNVATQQIQTIINASQLLTGLNYDKYSAILSLS